MLSHGEFMETIVSSTNEQRGSASELNELLCVDVKKDYQTVVRVITTAWADNTGAHFKRSLRVLKRKSFGMDVLHEECDLAGADECIGNIINFHDVGDGIYELIACNFSKDHESGYIDDWNLKLVPFDATLNRT